jgi:hypothetical protein
MGFNSRVTFAYGIGREFSRKTQKTPLKAEIGNQNFSSRQLLAQFSMS